MNTQNTAVTGARNAERKQNLETGSDAHAEASQSNRTRKPKITRAYIRHYSDSGQRTAYIEWSDGSRTEGGVTGNGAGLHMRALFARAQREGITIENESW